MKAKVLKAFTIQAVDGATIAVAQTNDPKIGVLTAKNSSGDFVQVEITYEIFEAFWNIKYNLQLEPSYETVEE